MISTPYFDKLQKIAYRTSKMRKDNYALSRSLSRLGFSDYEVIQITETECFLNPRESKRKTCTKCEDNKTVASFTKKKREIDGYNNQCKLCTRKAAKKSYVSNRSEYIMSKANAYLVKKIDERKNNK